MLWCCRTYYDSVNDCLKFYGEYCEDKPIKLGFAFLGRNVPDSIENDVIVKRVFDREDYVDSVGNLVENGEVSLNGLTACYYPDSPDLLRLLLFQYYNKVNPVESHKPASIAEVDEIECQSIDCKQLSKLLYGKQVLIFTGAGISVNSGIADLDGITKLTMQVLEPFDEFYRDLISGNITSRVSNVEKIHAMFEETEPTKSHWSIARLCADFGYSLATGNVDGLHEKTGIEPIFQNTSNVVIPKLGSYDVMLSIGLSDSGIGYVADEFKRLNPNGVICAINPKPQIYLSKTDYHIAVNSDIALEELVNNLVVLRTDV